MATPASWTHGLVVESVHRHAIEQSEPCQYQRAGALRTEELACRVEIQLCHQRLVRNHRTGLHPAAHDHRVGLGSFSQRRLRFHHDAVHRTDPGRRAGKRNAPPRRLDAVQDAERDQRVQFVETVEGKDGDVHGVVLPVA